MNQEKREIIHLKVKTNSRKMDLSNLPNRSPKKHAAEHIIMTQKICNKIRGAAVKLGWQPQVSNEKQK